MGLFKKDENKKMKEIQKIAEEKKKREIDKIKKIGLIDMPIPRGESGFRSSEYVQLLKEIEKKPHSKYEKICNISEKILHVKVSPKNEEIMKDHLQAAYINSTPSGVLSFTYILSILLFIVAFGALFAGAGMIVGLGLMILAAGGGYYFYNYPKSQAKVMGLKMSSDTVLAILYMVIYMRTSPNLEGALRFAAQNLKGPLSWDLKKLIWDIEVGTYSSADQAVVSYVYKWKEKNKEFAESLHLLRSVSVEPSRRNIIFDETINVILNGTRERARHYASGLRMPMMVIHAMGVLLPVMGLVLFPVIMIFMGDAVKPAFVFFGYNIALPAFIYFFTDYVLQTKPPTFSQPDISKAKGIPKLNRVRIGKRDLPILPFTLAIGIPLILIGIGGISSPSVYASVNFSILIIIGLASIIGLYGFIDSYQKIKIRRDIEKIENEFSVALFQLGNVISSGAPIELAIDKATANLKNLKIAELLEITSMNMKKFGYTFEQALFDKDVGAVWYYPSDLIQSIMQTVIESSKKSIKTAADSMIVISRYLKDMHNVKEEIDEILGETISSMKFLAMFLAPMVAGVTITMAVIILQILTNLGSTLGGLIESGGGATVAQSMLLVPWAMSGGLPITPAAFQMIVGIYMLETAILLSMFLNRIQYGEDAVGERSLMSKTVIISIVVYFISWLIVYSMFGSSISSLLIPGAV